MTVLLATNNAHKRTEFGRILAAHEIRLPAELGVEFSFEETGATFLENAVGKARALAELLPPDTRAGLVIVADDSGLCVDALDGAPGIYSARYGSPDGGATELPATERNALLLRALRGAEDRSAHFVCCMAALFADDRFAVVQETFPGEIAEEPAGANGFGYDPVFLLPGRGCTVAELREDEKDRISHRGRASHGIAAALVAMEANSGEEPTE
jgi:XTP/dITP diphosphohydrolase